MWRYNAPMRTLLLVCLVVQSFAQSIESPSPPRDRTEEKQRPKKENGGTESRPQSPPQPRAAVTSGVNQPAPLKEEPQTNEKANQIWKKAIAPETWSNWALFVAACMAAFIALKTLRAIRNQAEIARLGVEATRVAANATTVSANAAKQAADAAVTSNNLTTASLALAETQIGLLEQSNTLTRDSNTSTQQATELTRQSFVLSNRPRLIIRNVVLDEPSREIRSGRRADDEPIGQVKGRFRIANSGNGVATVKGSYRRVFNDVSQRLPMEPPYNMDFGMSCLPVGTTLQAGEAEECSFVGSGPTEDQIGEAILGKPGPGSRTGEHWVTQLELYVLGWVDYTDELGITRGTAFCRRYERNLDRFLPVDNPDYENAD